MNPELRKAVEKIGELSKISVASHVDPDGDAIGSMLGMAHILKQMGKEVVVRWHGNAVFPDQYDFLPGRAFISDETLGVDGMVALDCGSFNRLGEFVKEAGSHGTLVNIDHHPDNQGFGSVNVLESGISSTSELVYEFAVAAGVEIDPEIAICLYVGILTDTGRFQYSNTSARTHYVAADLISRGRIDVTGVFQSIFERLSYGSLQLMSSVVGKAVLREESRFIYSTVTRALIESTGGRLEELENLIDYLRSVKEAEVAALLKETEDGKFRVSLRSKGLIDVGAIARSLGGGGHRNAAAFVSDNGSENVILAIEERVRQAHVV